MWQCIATKETSQGFSTESRKYFYLTGLGKPNGHSPFRRLSLSHRGSIIRRSQTEFVPTFFGLFNHELDSNTFFASSFFGWSRRCCWQQPAIWSWLLAGPLCNIAVSISYCHDRHQRAWVLALGVYRRVGQRSHPSGLLADGSWILWWFYDVFNFFVGIGRAIATR